MPYVWFQMPSLSTHRVLSPELLWAHIVICRVGEVTIHAAAVREGTYKFVLMVSFDSIKLIVG